MNDIILSQQIRKRKRNARPAPPLPLFARKPRPVLQNKRPPLIAFSLIEKTASFIRGRFSVRNAVLAAFLMVGVVSLFSVLTVFSARMSVAALSAAEDPLYQRDMRSYARLQPITTASASEDMPPLDLAETFRFEKYTVKYGESLSSIAAKHELAIGSVIAANGIRNAKRIRAGVVLKIPNMDGLPYVVRKGDSLTRIASVHGIPLEAILDANELESADIHPGMNLFLPGARLSGSELRRAMGDLFVYPIIGTLTSPFGWRNDPFTGVRRFHAAVDLAAPIGTPIRASMEGRVSAVGYNSVYGKYVILTHDGGYQTWYAHMNEIRTEKGAYIKQGQRIGDVGSTGYSTGSHIHFAIFKNGRALNPLSFLSRP